MLKCFWGLEEYQRERLTYILNFTIWVPVRTQERIMQLIMILTVTMRKDVHCYVNNLYRKSKNTLFPVITVKQQSISL